MLRRFIARLILFTPLGNIEWVCNLYWWWIRRRHRLASEPKPKTLF